MRVAQPGGKFYTTEYLRNLCDLWDLRGSGITNMHGSTGDIIFLGTRTEQLEEIFFELTHKFNQDLGGSGSNLRTPADCIGQARCEFACYDTQALCYAMTQDYQDELHRPAFPYKFKFKFDGCPNCCVASIARADMSFIGTWRDNIRIDQEAVQAYIGGEIPANGGAFAGRDWGKFNIQKEVIELCPTECMWMEGNKLKIDDKECNRCMHCINVMPRALRIGEDRGLSILVGAKAPILDGAQMGSLLVPFIKVRRALRRDQGSHRKGLGLVDGGRQEPRASRRADEAPGLPEASGSDGDRSGSAPRERAAGPTPTSSGRKMRSRAAGRAMSTNIVNTIRDKGDELWHSFLQDTIPKSR